MLVTETIGCGPVEQVVVVGPLVAAELSSGSLGESECYDVRCD